MGWTAVSCAFILLLLTAACVVADDGSSEHFTITFKECRPQAGVIDTLEQAYGDVNGLFGTCPGHVEVVVIGDMAMDRIGKQVDAFSGWNKEFSAVILRRSALKNNSSLKVVFGHEMAHLAINEILCKKDASDYHWMEEGVCMAATKEPFDDAGDSKYIIEHGFLDTGKIYDAIKSEDCAVSKNGYMQSYGLVRYMERRYGFSFIKQLLECPDESLDAAFRRYAGESFETFYGEWKNSVMARGPGMDMPGSAGEAVR